MNRKTITIQTNEKKKGKLDQRSFTCQILDYGDQRIYALDDTKRDLGLKRFTLTEGCRIFDDGACYFIENIFYTERPARPFLVVKTESII